MGHAGLAGSWHSGVGTGGACRAYLGQWGALSRALQLRGVQHYLGGEGSGARSMTVSFQRELGLMVVKVG